MTEAGRTEYRHWWLNRFLKGSKRSDRDELIARPSMWDHDDKVVPVVNLTRDIYARVTKFLDKGGHLYDAFEALASQINPNFLRKYAIEKLGLIDPLD